MIDEVLLCKTPNHHPQNNFAVIFFRCISISSTAVSRLVGWLLVALSDDLLPYDRLGYPDAWLGSPCGGRVGAQCEGRRIWSPVRLSQSDFWTEEYNTRLSHLLRFVSLFTVVTTVPMDLICMKCHSKFISNPQKQKATLRAVYSWLWMTQDFFEYLKLL